MRQLWLPCFIVNGQRDIYSRFQTQEINFIFVGLQECEEYLV